MKRAHKPILATRRACAWSLAFIAALFVVTGIGFLMVALMLEVAIERVAGREV